MSESIIDVLIIGGGPAGLTAALYAARKELKTTVVSSDFGGQILLTGNIENYPGTESITGFELADKLEAHVRKYPVNFEIAQVSQLTRGSDNLFHAELDDGKELISRTVIVTAGKHSRQMHIEGETRLTGRGVSYCATCDGPFFRNKTVAVVGGGDSAVQAAMELAKLTPKVYLLVRSRIRASEILVERMKAFPQIEVLIGYSPVEILGKDKVQSVRIKNNKTGEEKELALDGIFVEIGGIPNTSFLPKDVQMNKAGEIVTDKNGLTNVPGLFAAGDVTDREDKQIVIAAGEGAAAALSAGRYLLRGGK
jgi:NADH-dependent peroxiredoxin subunit F